MTLTNNDLSMAFKSNNEIYLRKTHLYLNEMYYHQIYNQDEQHALNDIQLAHFKHVENVWMEHETSDIMNRYDCFRKFKSAHEVESILMEHPVYQHSLFTFLRQDASLDDIKHLLFNDSILNIEFFDYLALAVIGVSEEVRLEIIKNMWDEAGRGNLQKFHTALFKKIMTQLSLPYERKTIVNQMAWEGLAGINLFSYLALNNHHKMKYFGLLAATEMLDPPHYTQLLGGMNRAQKNKKLESEYYQEHVTVDVEHARGWMEQVILPELARRPDKLSDFWLGFYLRLDSVQRYYDNMLQYFLAQKAA